MTIRAVEPVVADVGHRVPLLLVSANAALFYEAEGRTAMGGSAIAAGAAGASGGGSIVMRDTDLAPAYTRRSCPRRPRAAGAHLSHIGTFRVYARIYTPGANSGTVTLAFEWAEGDFLKTTLTRQSSLKRTTTMEGKWLLIDLGSSRSTGILRAHSDGRDASSRTQTVVGTEVDIDWLMFVPVAEGSGIASGVAQFRTANTFVGYDVFDQTAGALAG